MEKRRYPTDQEAKEAIIEVGKRLYAKGFAAANDGNISTLVSENALWTTPTGVSKGYMEQDMLVKTDLAGNILSGLRQPSSELKMHLRIYRENPFANAVVHAHPPVAATFSAAGIPLDRAILQESVIQLGSVPIAPFALPGSDDVAESVAPYCRAYNGILLAHHGAVSWGDSVMQAYFRMEAIEYYATTILYSRMLGSERQLNEKQIDALIALRPKFGITSGGRPAGAN